MAGGVPTTWTTPTTKHGCRVVVGSPTIWTAPKTRVHLAQVQWDPTPTTAAHLARGHGATCPGQQGLLLLLRQAAHHTAAKAGGAHTCKKKFVAPSPCCARQLTKLQQRQGAHTCKKQVYGALPLLRQAAHHTAAETGDMCMHKILCMWSFALALTGYAFALPSNCGWIPASGCLHLHY